MPTPDDAAPSPEQTGQPPRDPRGLAALISELEADGFTDQLAAGDEGLRCSSCGAVTAPGEVEVTALRRTEGASDPADMLAVLAASCPRCGSKGTAVLNYGPGATLADVTVLRAVEDRDEPSV